MGRQGGATGGGSSPASPGDPPGGERRSPEGPRALVEGRKGGSKFVHARIHMSASFQAYGRPCGLDSCSRTVCAHAPPAGEGRERGDRSILGDPFTGRVHCAPRMVGPPCGGPSRGRPRVVRKGGACHGGGGGVPPAVSSGGQSPPFCSPLPDSVDLELRISSRKSSRTREVHALSLSRGAPRSQRGI